MRVVGREESHRAFSKINLLGLSCTTTFFTEPQMETCEISSGLGSDFVRYKLLQGDLGVWDTSEKPSVKYNLQPVSSFISVRAQWWGLN